MIEKQIIRNLLESEEYRAKVLPYIRLEYFNEKADQQIFQIITDFTNKYNRAPSLSSIATEIQLATNIPESDFSNLETAFNELVNTPREPNLDWLIDRTETFCKDAALTIAIRKSISVIKDEKRKDGLSKGSIPELFTDALSISFDPSLGHDYFKDMESQYNYYQEKMEKLPFDIISLNKMTDGGIEPSTLTIFIGGTNVGKSMVLCHFAASWLHAGKNVLYLTLEMSEKQTRTRIDANLMNVPTHLLREMKRERYFTKMRELQSKSQGNLIIKEYPTSSASVNHFRSFIKELKLKNGFVPDVILLDYINLCQSSRFQGGDPGSYSYVKAIAEEVRGLAGEFKVPIVSATQFNREGMKSTDPGMTDTSESMGLPFTVDLMVALVSTPELEESGQLLFKQLKNRLASKKLLEKFLCGIDRSRMRLYDKNEESARDAKDMIAKAESTIEENLHIELDDNGEFEL